MDLSDSRQRFLAIFLGIIVIVVSANQFSKWWFRPTAVEFDNLKYIQLLSTAISSRNPEMVSKVELAIKQRVESKQMSEKEFQHFEMLIGLTRQEKWDEAVKKCYEFAEAQLSRRRSQPKSTGHDHGHGDHHH
ncbi:hypothetical protein SH668x_000477 [Planctomicrobium sp. SH668]|uniref:hypothetical protein n=1 Tax=Planctomicrobium sp. SH668 TaxID=3448126 RepID=UPI003F5BF324